jgi:hypothetical protein
MSKRIVIPKSLIKDLPIPVKEELPPHKIKHITCHPDHPNSTLDEIPKKDLQTIENDLRKSSGEIFSRTSSPAHGLAFKVNDLKKFNDTDLISSFPKTKIFSSYFKDETKWLSNPIETDFDHVIGKTKGFWFIPDKSVPESNYDSTLIVINNHGSNYYILAWTVEKEARPLKHLYKSITNQDLHAKKSLLQKGGVL